MKTELPSIEPYGNYSSSNYGVHSLRVDVGELTVWFSYKTPVAFRHLGGPKIVRQNDWSTTTGKHLNAIDGGGAAKKDRVPGVEFERLYTDAVNNG